MLKVVSINRCEGTGIIERIEGNGWDIDANHIELNGINAHIIHGPENRFITLDGPAVEDLFKSLRDLLKENGELRALLDRDTTRKLNEECNTLTERIEEQDECIRHLENGLKEKDAAIKVLQFDKDRYKEGCKIANRFVEEKSYNIKTLEKELNDKNTEIDELNDKLKKYDNTQTLLIQHNNEKRDRIKTLNREVRDKDIEIERLNNSLSNYYELYEKCRVLENKLKLADKWNPIKDFIREITGEDIDFAVKTFPHFIPDYEITISVSRQEDDNDG